MSDNSFARHLRNAIVAARSENGGPNEGIASNMEKLLATSAPLQTRIQFTKQLLEKNSTSQVQQQPPSVNRVESGELVCSCK